MQEIHETLFELLYAWSRIKDDFRFRTRKTNRYGRLQKKYWFIGNDDYLSIGFWTGNDWQRKLPYISFMVEKDGSFWLFFTSKSSKEVSKFICNKIFPDLKINLSYDEYVSKGHEYHYIFNTKNLHEALNEFLNILWPKIDLRIRSHEHPEIGIFDKEEFENDIKKILAYRRENLISTASKLSQFVVANYGPISICSIQNIPKETQFIFFTGENGTGKTSILKAIASAITARKISHDESYSNNSTEYFQASLFFHSESLTDKLLHRQGNVVNFDGVFTKGYAAYGPYRGKSRIKMTESSQRDLNNSLFLDDAVYYDLESKFSEWFFSKNKQEFGSISYAIKEFLEHVLLNVSRVEFQNYKQDVLRAEIFELGDGGNELDPVNIDKLSSGYASILTMMSDMMIRLFDQQPEINDIGELTGIVIIDEIDIHLHPKFQKHLVMQLAHTFPNIQFLVSTHSPIPLLGAPKESVIVNVKRNKEKGVYLERLDDQIDFTNLLPNTLLSSPIFGFRDLFPDSHDDENEIRTEDEFDELMKNDQIRSQLKELARNLSNEEG